MDHAPRTPRAEALAPMKGDSGFRWNDVWHPPKSPCALRRGMSMNCDATCDQRPTRQDSTASIAIPQSRLISSRGAPALTVT